VLLQRAEKQTNEERESIIMHHYEIYAFWYPILKYLQKHIELFSLSLSFLMREKSKKKKNLSFLCLDFVVPNRPTNSLSSLYPLTTKKKKVLNLLSLSLILSLSFRDERFE
jgi:hypothetical protein